MSFKSILSFLQSTALTVSYKQNIGPEKMQNIGDIMSFEVKI